MNKFQKFAPKQPVKAAASHGRVTHESLNRLGARSAAPAAPARTQPPRGRYAGIKAARDNYPLLGEGSYAVKVIKTTETSNPRTGDFFRIDLMVARTSNDMHGVGTMTTVLQCVTRPKAFEVGGPKVKSFVIAATGFDNENDFEESITYPDGGGAGEAWADLIDAASGVQGTPFGDNPLEDCWAWVQAFPGKTDPKTGTVYQQYQWAPCSPEEAAELEAELAGAAS